jgi:hypothetical protein
VPQFRDQYLERPHRRRLSPGDAYFAEIMSRHSDAVSKGEPCYIDPTTGLSVFTAAFLADRGYCCDSGCRHCPYIVD